MSLVSGSSMSHFTASLHVQGIFYFFHVWGEKRGWCVCVHLYSLVRYLKLVVLKFLNEIGIVFSQVHNF